MQLHTLGTLRLEGARFRQPKPLVLLSYLSLEGAQPKRHLAELFWPEGNRMKSLSMTLTRLRQGAGEVVESDTGRAWATLDSDVAELLSALDRSDWRRASESYAGAFLEGLVLEDSSVELEEWVYSTREYLAERVQHGLLNLAEEAARSQDFEAAGRWAERAYRLPGLAGSEPASLERLYPLLCAAGSLRAPEVRKELEDYGIPVLLGRSEAQSRYRPPAAGVGGLPAVQTSFVGRGAERQELERLLGESRLLTLLGVAGVGKTRLALHLAHELQRRRAFEGVCFVRLEAIDDPRALVPAMLQALEPERRPASDPLRDLCGLLAGRSVLLVLDNFEQLSGEAGLLSELLGRLPGLKLLVTSRERLGLAEEQLFHLDGLPAPPAPTDAGDDLDYDAVRLFVERARLLKPHFDLDAEGADVGRICRLLGGSPLAIELAASWVRLMSCADIAAEIQVNLDFLESSLRNAPERHRSLRAALDHSWALLAPRERQVLRKLSVFRDGFRREAASAVAGATIPLLAALVDKSLLRVLPNGRYDRHPLLFQYTAEKLAAEADEAREVQAAHGRYYLEFLAQQEPLTRQGRQQEVIAALREEWENLSLALEGSLREPDGEALGRFLGFMHISFGLRGAHHEGLELLDRIAERLAESGESFRALRGRTLAERAWYCYRLGRYAEAEAGVEASLALLPADDAATRARAQVTLSAVAEQGGDPERAIGLLEEALELSRRAGDEGYRAVVLGNLAGLWGHVGDVARAELHYRDALEIHRRHGEIAHLIRDSNNLANLYAGQDDYDRAEPLWQEALEEARKLGYGQTLPHLLTNLSNAYERRGDVATAIALNLEALERVAASGQGDIRVTVLNNLALLHAEAGDVERAFASSDEALELAWAMGALPKLMQALLARGELLLKGGGHERAATLLAFVAAHPATVGHERDYARDLLTPWAAELGSPPEIAERTLEEVVRDALKRAG